MLKHMLQNVKNKKEKGELQSLLSTAIVTIAVVFRLNGLLPQVRSSLRGNIW